VSRVAATLGSVALGLVATLAHAAPPMRFATLDDAHGLSENSVTSLAEDAQGFLWIGTQNGLNRFDGLEFRVYSSGRDSAATLVEDYVNVLLTDRRGVLWIGTFSGGLSRYDPQAGAFDTFLHDPTDPRSLAHNDVSALLVDDDGSIFVGTRGGGLQRLEPGTRTFERVALGGPRDSVHVGAIARSADGGVWVGVLGAGLVELGRDRRVLRRFDARTPGAIALPSDDVTALLLDRDGALWIGTRRSGLARLDAGGDYHIDRSDPSRTDALVHNAINELYQDSRGRVFVATAGGLDEYDPASGGFRHHRHAPGNPLSLPYDDVSSVLEDSSGTLWIGTGGRGLARHEPPSPQFEFFVHDPADPGSLAPSGVWSVREGRDGSLWVGTFSSGLHRRAPCATHFVRDVNDPARGDSLSDNDVRALLEDRLGRWWVGTRRGLNRWDPGARGFVRYLHDRDAPDSLAHDFVRVLYEDRAGTIWVGTYGGGLDRYDPAGDGFAHHRQRDGDDASLSDDRIYSLAQTDDATLWIGTHGGGLNRLVLSSGRVTRHVHDVRAASSIASDRVLTLVAAHDGGLWVGTAAGLDHLGAATTRFAHQTALATDAVLALAADERGALWMSKTDGLVRFDPERGEVRQFDLDEQLVSNEFNGGAVHRGASGRIYFGGVEGLVAVAPSVALAESAAGRPVLTEFLGFNRPIQTRRFDPTSPLREPIEYARRLELPHSLETFGFGFTALRTADPARSTFAYRLDGFDARWIETGARRRSATYTNVPPGEYVFRVRVTDAEGRWMRDEATVSVAVLPPPWRTRWAYAGYALLAAAVLVAIYAVRRRRDLARERAQRAALAVLDARVRERTEQLEARTQELEATIDALNRARDDLVEAEKMASLGRLVAGVAHEVNTPLGVGITALSFLRERLGAIRAALSRHLASSETEALIAPVADAGAMAESNLARAAQLVKSFKQVAVDQSATGIRTIVLRPHLESILQSLQPSVKKAGHRIELVCDAALEMTNRPDALYQILANLVLNSVLHAYPAGRAGTIGISVEAQGESLALSYRDDGCGMSPDVAQHLFEPFFTTKRGDGGTGLGMHIVYNLVTQALAGRIRCRTASGEGVQFDIVFPRTHPHARTAVLRTVPTPLERG